MKNSDWRLELCESKWTTAKRSNITLWRRVSFQGQSCCRLFFSAFEVTSCFTQLYAPSPPHSVELDIIFFHGLQLDLKSDPHLSTWRSGDDSDELWPKSWLPSEYPKARILVASYDAFIQTTATTGRQDLFSVSETLFHDLCIIREEQGRNCPLILVGHSFGGLVIKKLCVIADARKDVDPFIQRVRGIFFYATPHRGMTQEFLDEQGIGRMSANEHLLTFAKELSTGAARLHEEFLNVKKKYEWKILGVGESCVSCFEGACSSLIIKEASSRYGDEFCLLQCDHFSICRPQDRQSSAYLQLVKLITACGKKEKKGKRASSRIVGIDSLLSELIGYLEHHTFLGLGGMGGVGKTTMAELLFEELEEGFEYTYFVEELKLITGSKDDVKGKIWTKMRRHDESIAETCRWDDLRGKKLLMVLDDIDKAKHVDLILDIARVNAMPGSRYIVTSRDMGLFKWLDEPRYGKTHICEIPLLRDEDAKRLFYSYAFPDGENPPETLGGIVEEIVRVCAGLPLTLKVLGTHLRAERDERSWAEIPSALETAQSISTLEERIWAVLRVSYDALQDDEKDLFLEMACTFTRDDQWFPYDEIKWVLDSKYKSVNNLLKALAEKCLIKIMYVQPSGDDKWWLGEDIVRMYHPFQMHEHLRSMGYKIAIELGRSVQRLICPLGEKNQSVQYENISPQEIATLVVTRGEDGSLSPCQLALLQSISDMTGLCYLDLVLGVPKAMYLRAQSGLHGDEEEEEKREIVDARVQELFPDGILSLPASAVMARFFGYSWEFSFKSETIRFEKLVVLDLKINDVWPSDYLSVTVCERLPALECLRLRCSEPIKSLGVAFEKLRRLQHLCLSCRSYEGNGAELPGSFRYLSSLKYLDLRGTSFPYTVGNWSKLEHLTIMDCLELVELPLEDLSRLRHLSITFGNESAIRTQVSARIIQKSEQFEISVDKRLLQIARLL
ncbi:hypothetical protein R1sor_018937 [Riccia sorocarpa]|uniref:NB-ARC domain-containing protein n=1 Tax=Riccia sorocarpa TaxID=122646 RepID=A0ABD3IEQ7_9MARC